MFEQIVAQIFPQVAQKYQSQQFYLKMDVSKIALKFGKVLGLLILQFPLVKIKMIVMR